MNDRQGAPPLDADQIQRRFKSPPVIVTRPLVLAGIKGLAMARRFKWSGQGVEQLRKLKQPLVLAANHVSHADTAAILGTLPRPIRSRTAVAAALDVFGPSSTGRSLRNEALQLVVAAGFHAFAFDRHGPPLRSIRTSTRLLQDGWNLLLYPEGTRSRTGQLGHFKAGIGVLARFTKCPIVPIHVEGGDRLLPHGRFLPQPAKITVRYGVPLYARPGESPSSFADRLRDQVCRLGDVVDDAAPVPTEGDRHGEGGRSAATAASLNSSVPSS